MWGVSSGPEEVALVERFCGVWSGSDLGGAFSVLSPDVVYRPIASLRNEVCRGQDAFRRFWDGCGEVWADDAVWRLETVRVYGDAVGLEE